MLMQKIVDLIIQENSVLSDCFLLIKQDLHHLCICTEEYIYDALASLTNSIIHPNQRRASYRELVGAFMKGIDEFIKRDGINEGYPKFTCQELIGEKVTAMDMLHFQNEKSEKKKLENENVSLQDEINKLNIQIKE